MTDSPLSTGEPEPHPPRHRRDGVPLDGAPDLGLYTAPAPVISEPVTTSTWTDPGQYLAPSPVPPEYPAAPTVSEYEYPALDDVPDTDVTVTDATDTDATDTDVPDTDATG